MSPNGCAFDCFLSVLWLVLFQLVQSPLRDLIFRQSLSLGELKQNISKYIFPSNNVLQLNAFDMLVELESWKYIWPFSNKGKSHVQYPRDTQGTGIMQRTYRPLSCLFTHSDSWCIPLHYITFTNYLYETTYSSFKVWLVDNNFSQDDKRHP